MVETIILMIIKLAFNFLSEESKESLKSELEMTKGRAQSVEDSYEEQIAADKKAEEAKEKAEAAGSDDDIFGSEDYNA